MAALDRDKIHFLPNTSGARNAEEASAWPILPGRQRTSWLKLEVTRTAHPAARPVDTSRHEQLVKRGSSSCPT